MNDVPTRRGPEIDPFEDRLATPAHEIAHDCISDFLRDDDSDFRTRAGIAAAWTESVYSQSFRLRNASFAHNERELPAAFKAFERAHLRSGFRLVGC